jgi:hypothetical protein
MIGSSSFAVAGAGNIWLELRNRSCISLQRETAKDRCSERVVGDLDTGDVVVFG